ncbi:oxidoreductase-like protein 1 [Podospora australis]|uniref:Oxidoreductase-like protein 1 n=1 Tax=Podospora australis TaxID=1536484 RepID=A0AAN7AKA6_9PEZI|nr:oxidoreductase-like protein 1 [Podospora australis]
MADEQPPFPTPVLPYHRKAYPAIDPTRPELSSKGKSIFITGAGSGIGAEVASAFAKSGAAHIGLGGRRLPNLEETKAKIASSHPNVKVHIFQADIADEKSITEAVASFASQTDSGKIDVLVANAGYSAPGGTVDKFDPEELKRNFEINVFGQFNTLRAFHPLAAPGAVVVHTTTGLVHTSPFPGQVAYQSSKLAATRIFDAFRSENPEIRVIQFHPGLPVTDIYSTISKYAGPIPTDDIDLSGAFAVWAASPEAAFLDGRLVWASWDIDSLKAQASELSADPFKYTVGLLGFPKF